MTAEAAGDRPRKPVSRRAVLIAVAVVAAAGLSLGYVGYLGPHRSASAREQLRGGVCGVADVVVATATYPQLEQFLATEWRYARGATERVDDAALSAVLRTLPQDPDPAAMQPVADYCHAHGLGIMLHSA
jgi:hypothetical protein